VATLGPASIDKMPELIKAGLDVARLNMSHGSKATHERTYANVRRAGDESGHSVGVLVDLQGPKIRLGTFGEGPVMWATGERVTVTVEDVVGTHDRVSTTYKNLADDVKPGDKLSFQLDAKYLFGSPVAGAEITLQAGGDRPPSFNSATSDARGAFRVLEVGDGAWKLRVTREGYATAEREVRVDGSAAEDVEIRLDPTQGVTIDALLANGQPPDRIRVAAVDAAGETVATGTYPTGENGRTKVSEVPPGSWLLLVESDQSAPVTLQAAVPGPALRALLPPAGQVHIQVPALANDAAAAKVVLTGPGGPYRAIDWDGRVKSEWELGDGALSFSRVPAGVWQVVARAADGRSWTGTVTVTPGGAAEVVLK